MNELTERELTELLSRWRVAEPADGPLRTAVWRRIAVREAESRERRAGLDWFVGLLGKPAFAAVTVAAFVLLGLAAAEVRFQSERGASAEVLEAEYFRAINPISLAAHRREP